MLITEEQKLNSKNNLFQTLETMSSIEEQINYKKAVSFVHIPHELICQWDGAFMSEQRWFREIWTNDEWNSLNDFDKEFRTLYRKIPNIEFPDIPEVLENKTWVRIMKSAKKVLAEIS